MVRGPIAVAYPYRRLTPLALVCVSDSESEVGNCDAEVGLRARDVTGRSYVIIDERRLIRIRTASHHLPGTHTASRSETYHILSHLKQ